MSLNLDVESLNTILELNEKMHTISNLSQTFSTNNLTLNSNFSALSNASINNNSVTLKKGHDKKIELLESFYLISYVQSKIENSLFSFSNLYNLVKIRIDESGEDCSKKGLLCIFTRMFMKTIKEIKKKFQQEFSVKKGENEFDNSKIRIYKEKLEKFTSFFNKHLETYVFSNYSTSFKENNNNQENCLKNGKINSNENMKILVLRRSYRLYIICFFTFFYLLLFIQHYCCNFTFYIYKKNKYIACLLASIAFIYINDQEIRKLKLAFVESQNKCKRLQNHKTINDSLQNISNLLQILLAECQLMIYLQIALFTMILLRGVWEFFITNSCDMKINNKTQTKTFKITERSSKNPYRSCSISKPVQINFSYKDTNFDTPYPNKRSTVSGITQIINVFGYNVWITNTGKKYHRQNCQYLKNMTHSFPQRLSELAGFTPCIKCKP